MTGRCVQGAMKTLSLDVIDVARPCEMDWYGMRGDDRVRFCGHCSLHVYNLSEMPAAEALRLVSETEGRLCVRFYRRADGTVVSRDCGIMAAAKRLGRWATAATACALSAFVAAMGLTRSGGASPTPKDNSPSGDCEQVMGKMLPPATQPAVRMGEARVMMGSVAPVINPPTPPRPPATQPTSQPAVKSE